MGLPLICQVLWSQWHDRPDLNVLKARHEKIITTRPILRFSHNKDTCKRTQQLPTLLANNVGRCCIRVGSGVQTDATTSNNVGGCSASWEGYNPWVCVSHVQCACVAPTMLEELCKRKGSNNFGLRFGDHGTKQMLGVVSSKVWPVSNFAQQLPTTCNNMHATGCENGPTQHVINIQQSWELLTINVASVCMRLNLKFNKYLDATYH